MDPLRDSPSLLEQGRPGGRASLLAPLLLLTVVSGVVDALSFLALGRVFVANMTGNVVLLGFATAGAPGLSIPASVLALAAFLAAGVIAGRLMTPRRDEPLRFVRIFTATQIVFFVAAITVAAVLGTPDRSPEQYTLIALLGFAMGVQNAGARALAIPDLTTTVLTMTLTGLASEAGAGGESRGSIGRRLGSVGAMLAGAFGSAWLLLHVGVLVPLAVALALVAGVCAYAHVRLSGASGSAAPHPTVRDRVA